MPGTTDTSPLDPERLEQRLAPLGVRDLRPLTGGASSLTFAGWAAAGGGASGATRVVVKVAPPGVAPVLHRDVLRQARLLRVLRTTAVPVPEVLFEEEGDPPDVPPLFVMSFVEGTSFEPLFDHGQDEDAAAVAEAARRAARTLAELHALDPAALGLGGEPVVGPAEEIDRWSRLLRTVDPELAPGWQGVAGGLADSRPAAEPPAVVHGDFRLGNLLRAGPRITAVVDWEIWSVGDPRVDLGWFLTNADPATYRRATPYAATFPSPDELADAYSGVLGRSLPALEWFRALACFKSTATWSLIVKHNRRRPEPDPELEAMAGVLPHLLERATELLSLA